MHMEISTDTVAQILKAAKNRQEIQTDAAQEVPYLQDASAAELLSMMAKADLLRFDNRHGTYHTTRKGQAFLKTYRRLGEFIELIDEEIGL